MRLNPFQNTIEEYKALYGSRWHKEFKLDKRASVDPDVYRKKYYKEVWSITEANKALVKHVDKRGYYEYHIDHKIPISVGFKNSIPPDIIADPSNLQMMWWEENIEKNNSIILDKENEWIANTYKLE